MKKKQTVLAIRQGKLKIVAQSKTTESNLPKRHKNKAIAALLAAARANEKVIVHSE